MRVFLSSRIKGGIPVNLLFKGSILITEEGVIDSHTHYQMSVRGADTADDFFYRQPFCCLWRGDHFY